MSGFSRFRKPRFLALLVLVLLIAGGVYYLSNGTGGDQNVHVVERSDLTVKEPASGTLKSANSTFIKPLRSPGVWRYTLTHMAEEGVKVKEGDVLLRFDEKRLRDRLERAESDLATQKKRLEKTQLEGRQRLQDLTLEQVELEAEIAKLGRTLDIPEEYVAGAELAKQKLDHQLKLGQKRLNEINLRSLTLNQQGDLRKRQKKIKRHESEIADLNRAIERMTVRAPKAGLVVYIPRWNGEKPKIGDSVWRAQTILELPDLEQMQVMVTIPERGAGKVAVGQSVEVRLDAKPDHIFMGTIQSLGTIFRRKSHSKPSIVFDALVTLNQLDPEIMRPGMAASLEITVEKIPDVVQIPVRALRHDEAGDFVLLSGPYKKRRTVLTGIRDGDHITIIKGLEGGESIVLQPQAEGEGS